MWNHVAFEFYGPLFAVNLLVFLGWRFGGGAHRVGSLLRKYFLLQPNRIVSSSLLFSSFSHATLLHFGVNMFAFWSLSSSAYAFKSPVDMVALYCSAGTISALVSLIITVLRGGVMIPSLGASGALFFFASWVRKVHPLFTCRILHSELNIITQAAFAYPDLQFSIIFLPWWYVKQ